MPDYKETNIVTKSWRRSNRVQITNSVGVPPMIEFTEEDAVNDGILTNVYPAGFIKANFIPENTFDILNPETGEVVGTATHMDVYVLLHSLYINLAVQRDLQT